MVIPVLAVIIGLLVLVWSADLFVEGATELAVKFNMPSFLIGVIILGFGTSAPEMVVSALSALDGSPSLALGNAFGSNVMNIALVLGLSALICPIAVKADILKKDMPLLLIATALVTFQLYDASLTRFEGIIMLGALVTLLTVQVILNMQGGKDDIELDLDIDVDKEEIKTGKSFAVVLVGLVFLLASSKAIVYGAVELARFWGMSELIIGLTIVAVGTSLPELVASIVAARKGESDMALGNIVGSNLFNTLGVVGLAAVISPMLGIDSMVFSRDMMVVIAMTVILFILCLVAIKKQGQLFRISGVVLLTTFIAYTGMLVNTAIV